MGLGNEMGTSTSVDEGEDSIFGLVLLNDWSARDIQKWEMAPLGTLNSKNWVSALCALLSMPHLIECGGVCILCCIFNPQDQELVLAEAGDVVCRHFAGQTLCQGVMMSAGIKHLAMGSHYGCSCSI